MSSNFEVTKYWYYKKVYRNTILIWIEKGRISIEKETITNSFRKIECNIN